MSSWLWSLFFFFLFFFLLSRSLEALFLPLLKLSLSLEALFSLLSSLSLTHSRRSLSRDVVVVALAPLSPHFSLSILFSLDSFSLDALDTRSSFFGFVFCCCCCCFGFWCCCLIPAVRNENESSAHHRIPTRVSNRVPTESQSNPNSSKFQKTLKPQSAKRHRV